MGTFQVKVSVGNIHGGDMHEVEALVDTGASDSAFPADLLKDLRVPATGESVEYILADSTVISCQRGFAMVAVSLDDGTIVDGVCPVAFWADDAGTCIGATALQNLMLGVDAPNERLVKVTRARRGWLGSL